VTRLFTVVIPTFNRAGLLPRAIASVMQQTVAAAEIVVVDDGSTDGTPSVCAAHGSAITYLRQPNAGVAAARNAGILHAASPWVAFLDSDDYWTPEHLARMEAAIRHTGGKARFYFSDMGLPAPGATGTTLWTSIGFHPRSPFHLVEDGTAWMLLRRQPAQVQCSVFEGAVLKESGGFDPRYHVTEDVELFCRLGIDASVCAVSGVGCVQTSDDAAENRLSAFAEADSQVFWRCNTLLWRSVLETFPRLERPYRSLVRSNLADTYLRLSKSLWRSRNVAASVWFLLRALGACEPALLWWLVRHRTFRGWGQHVRALGGLKQI
jgi:glycosyltransferase involved in cell wall biosynthesis